MTTTEAPPFSEVLREGTMAAHRDAEGSRFVGALMRGEVDLAAAVDLAAQHHTIYTALESTGERWTLEPTVAPFLVPGLRRVPALESDLAELLGSDWRERMQPSEATLVYAEHIRSAGGSSPERYVAHHYTRVLGDLSGGQVIRKALHKRFGLPESSTSFYDFGEAGHPGELKVAYRENLDNAGWTAEERGRLVEEANMAFELNQRVFASLEQRHCADA